MADEKKTVKKEHTSNTEKKPNIFKRIGKAIAKFFKDLRGETKKIVWPGRQMVIKSTGIVLAAILVIGAGIWVIDFALSGAITAINRAASETEVTTTEAVSGDEETEEASENADEADEEDTTESTTEA